MLTNRRSRGAINGDAAVAWLLAEVAAPHLTGEDRSMAFVELGCGEAHLAIERMLTRITECHLALPAKLQTTLATWLDCYADSPDEETLRTLIAQTCPLSPL